MSHGQLRSVAPRLALGLVAALVAVMAAACSSNPSDGASGSLPPFESVVMIGDSITEGSKQVLEEAFAASGYDDVRVEGLGGRRMSVGARNGTETLESVLAQGADPDLWVIELGTNDLAKYTKDDYRAQVEAYLELIPDDAPVVWVNTYWRDELDDSREFNSILGEIINERDDATVADWFTIVSSPGQDLLVADGVHPNSDGSRALSMMVFEAISRLG